MQFVGRKLKELDDVRSQFFDYRERLPADVRCRNILDTIEDGLLLDVGLPEDLLHIRDLYVAHLDLERPEAGGDLLLEVAGHAERIVPPDDGDDDIVLIEDVVFEHGMNNIRGDLLRVLSEEKGRSADLVYRLVDLVVAQQEHIQR